MKILSFTTSILVLMATSAIAQTTRTAPSRTTPTRPVTPAQFERSVQPGRAEATPATRETTARTAREATAPGSTARARIMESSARQREVRPSIAGSRTSSAALGSSTLFRQFDANRDQRLTPGEFHALARRAGSATLRLSTRNFRLIDTNKDGFLNQAELSRHIGSQPGEEVDSNAE
jgi:hypothetical protein